MTSPRETGAMIQRTYWVPRKLYSNMHTLLMGTGIPATQTGDVITMPPISISRDDAIRYGLITATPQADGSTRYEDPTAVSDD